MNPIRLSGHCLCGAVHYRIEGSAADVTHCHCDSCRRASGAAFVSWFTVRADQVRWGGEGRTLYHSSAAVERGFCPRCGSTLSYRHASDPGLIDLTLATLDAPATLEPASHCWWSEHLPWAEPSRLAGLPCHPHELDAV